MYNELEDYATNVLGEVNIVAEDEVEIKGDDEAHSKTKQKQPRKG